MYRISNAHLQCDGEVEGEIVIREFPTWAMLQNLTPFGEIQLDTKTPKSTPAKDKTFGEEKREIACCCFGQRTLDAGATKQSMSPEVGFRHF